MPAQARSPVPVTAAIWRLLPEWLRHSYRIHGKCDAPCGGISKWGRVVLPHRAEEAKRRENKYFKWQNSNFQPSASFKLLSLQKKIQYKIVIF
jgi:hypothetical protein